MLTVLCPNCRHRFSAAGCCSSMLEINSATLSQRDAATDNYYRQQVRLAGGGLIQDRFVSNQHDNIEIAHNPRFSNGGGLMQQRTVQPDARNLSCFAEAMRQQARPLLIDEDTLRRSFEQALMLHKSNTVTKLEAPPSGCQELPGTRRETPSVNANSTSCSCSCKCCSSCSTNEESKRNLCQVASNKDCPEHHVTDSGDIEIKVNATVRLPPSYSSGNCTLNITATTSTTPTTHTAGPIVQDQQTRKRIFNSGGVVSITAGNLNVVTPQTTNTSNREESPATPVSWVTPCPWGFDGGYDWAHKDAAKLAEIRKVLQTCGWYYEGLTWQQSEVLLKDASVGRWLLRDSSDSRYTFAISVRTERGPTSVRVFYFMGKFRLDSVPGEDFRMPLFDCPIKMLEYYCKEGPREEVWVDCKCQHFSHIYMSEPLVKQVRSLSHLSRLVVNKNQEMLKTQKEKLPPVIKSYLSEYPYTL